MEDIDRIAKYEIAVERRMEKACERDGWIASVHVSFGADYVVCQLEKFCRDEVKDEDEARRRLEEFALSEFGFALGDNPAALRRDAETIPNTIAPYHVVMSLTVPVDVRKVA